METSTPDRRLPFLATLTLAVALGAALRLPLLTLGADSYRLTESFNIEEVENLRLSTGMLHKGTLNPHAFEYPSLFYYLSLGVEAPLRASGHATWGAYLVGVRSLSLLFGLATIAAVGLLARRIGGPRAGLLAAVLAAFDRTLIDASTLAKPNGAQVFFVTAAFLAMLSLASRPRVTAAAGAAALLGLAAASKWLGALGLAPLLMAPMLAEPTQGPRGLGRLLASIRAALRARVEAWRLVLPVAVFGAVFVASAPYALLAPREFGFGLAQTFMAQSLHRLDLPWWAPLATVTRSLGPIGASLAATGILWAAWRVARWDSSTHDRGLALVLGWVLAYGALVLFVLVRLPSYVDLWVPFLAVLAGTAWAGNDELLRRGALRAGVLVLALGAGIASNGAYAWGRAALARWSDTRVEAGRWLDAHAAASDSVLADLSVFVPDRFEHVQWNWWGSPPRVVYDESRTWGWDPRWPEWYGGHRRLVFENAKWTDPVTLLARRPRWVVTSGEWARIRAHPSRASESAAPDYDRSLSDGRAGYVLRASFEPRPGPENPWVLLTAVRSAPFGLAYAGPPLRIFERAR